MESEFCLNRKKLVKRTKQLGTFFVLAVKNIQINSKLWRIL